MISDDIDKENQDPRVPPEVSKDMKPNPGPPDVEAETRVKRGRVVRGRIMTPKKSKISTTRKIAKSDRKIFDDGKNKKLTDYFAVRKTARQMKVQLISLYNLYF